jgi:hypothetical protein
MLTHWKQNETIGKGRKFIMEEFIEFLQRLDEVFSSSVERTEMTDNPIAWSVSKNLKYWQAHDNDLNDLKSVVLGKIVDDARKASGDQKTIDDFIEKVKKIKVLYELRKYLETLAKSHNLAVVQKQTPGKVGLRKFRRKPLVPIADRKAAIELILGETFKKLEGAGKGQTVSDLGDILPEYEEATRKMWVDALKYVLDPKFLSIVISTSLGTVKKGIEDLTKEFLES